MAGVVGKIPDFTPNEGEPPRDPVAQNQPVPPPQEEQDDEGQEAGDGQPDTTAGEESQGGEVVPPVVPPPADGSQDPAAVLDQKQRELAGLKHEELDITQQIALMDQQIADTKRNIVSARRERRERRTTGEGEGSGDVIVPQPVDLSDLDPDYVKDIDRVVQARGYVRKGDVITRDQQYLDVVEEEKRAWVANHPEFDENTYEGSANWEKLQEELRLFARPPNPRDVRKILDKAAVNTGIASKKPIKQPVNPALMAAKNRNIRLAGAGGGTGGGGGGAPRSGGRSFTAAQVEQYRRGGFTEEDIAEMQQG